MIDVIIVNYEGNAMALDAIKTSLDGHDRSDIRFVVVDNGSRGRAHAALFENSQLVDMLGGLRETSDEEIEFHIPFESIEESGGDNPQIKPTHRLRAVHVTRRWLSHNDDIFIKLDRNYGYETGVNVGMAVDKDGGFAGTPDWSSWSDISDEERRSVCDSYRDWLKGNSFRPRNDVVLLGSDVRPYPGCFSELEKTAQLHSQIGLVGAKLVQRREGGLFVVGGGYTDDPEQFHLRGWDASPGPWHTFQVCPWLTFSCVYIKRECIGAVGTMDMRFFPYAGDNDYSRRAREQGFANVYCPTAWALHQQESTTVVLVMRAMSAKEWNDRSAESQRYFHFKWTDRLVPVVELPADIFAETRDWPGR
jgi:GT2 family glycosyltransferase